MKLIRLFLGNFSGSEYRRGFAYIFSSKLLIAFVAFLTTPFLARLFEPSEYGLFALMTSTASIVSIITSLTLPSSLLVIQEKKIGKSSKDIIILAGIFTLFFALFSIVLVNHQNFKFFIKIPSPVFVVILITASSFLITLGQILANINIRFKEFGNNVIVNLADNFSIRIASLLLGSTGYGMFGLFYSDLLGKAVNIMTQLYLKKISWSKFPEKLSFGIRSIIATVVENKNYPLYNLPVSLISTFSGQLILWILVLGFSKADVGYFTMAMGILNIPLMLFSNSLQPLLTSKLFENSSKMPVDRFLNLIAKLSLLSVAVYGMIFLLAPLVVEVYLGKKWLSSIPFIQIMCFPFALQLLGNSLGGGFFVFQKQRANFVIKMIFLLVLLVGCYLLVYSGADLTNVISFYAIVLFFEEISKVIYLTNQLRYAGNS